MSEWVSPPPHNQYIIGPTSFLKRVFPVKSLRWYWLLNQNNLCGRPRQYWINQDIVFDYTADLAGTGDRSEYISSY